MAIGAKLIAISDPLFRWLFRFRFRYDLFLSYARGDAKEYAFKLRDQLKSLDFSCFVDFDELPVGHSLGKELRRALRRSATLVVVGSERALKSRYVELEIAEFARTGRAILPIDFQGTLGAAPWATLREREIVWIDEVKEALAKGVPSPIVADSIDRLFKYTRRNVRIRGQVLAAMLLFLAGAAVSIFLIQREVKAATVAQVGLRHQTKVAGEATKTAWHQEQLAQAATREAKKQEQQAAVNAKRAKLQEGIARENADRALREQRQAEASTREAQARLLAAESGLAYPAELSKSVLLAVESLQHRRTVEGLIALRRGLALLPRRSPALPSSSGSVNALAFRPDGRSLAIGGTEGLVLLDPNSGRREKVEAMGNRVGALAYSQDGRWLAAGVDREIHVLEVATGKVSKLLPRGSEHPITSLTLSADGKYLASTGQGDHAARLFERGSEDWREVLPSPVTSDQKEYVLTVALSPEGRWLALGSVREIVILDVKKGGRVASANADGEVWSAVWSADGHSLATAGNRGAWLWKISLPEAGGPPSLEHQGDLIPEARRELALSGDGSALAAVDSEGVARLWKISGGERSRMMEAERVSAVAFAPDGRQLVTASGENVRFWPADATEEWVRFEREKEVQAVAFSPSGRWLAMAGGDRAVRVVAVPRAIESPGAAEPASWPEVVRLDLPAETLGLAFSPDDRWLAATTAGVALVFDTRSWKVIAQQQVEDGESAGWSADGRWLVARGKKLTWLRAGAWTALPPLGYRQKLTRVSFSPDGQWMSTWTAPYLARGLGLVEPTTTRIYEAATGRRAAWQSHADEDLKKNPMFGRRSPEMRDVEDSGGAPQGGRIDLLRQEASWKAVRIDKPAAVTSPDRQWRAVMRSGDLSLEDIASEREVPGPAFGEVHDFAFSPDSRWLVTAGEDKTVRVWPLSPLDRIEQACRRLTRNLEAAEWPPELRGTAAAKSCPSLP
jgi:WD40 repeat protein